MEEEKECKTFWWKQKKKLKIFIKIFDKKKIWRFLLAAEVEYENFW